MHLVTFRRREFLKSTLSAGVAALWLPARRSAACKASGEEPLRYELSRTTPTRMYDGHRCWCHPRAGIVPGAGQENQLRVVMTMNTLDVSGSDVFKSMFSMQTDDLGQTWSEPGEVDALAPRTVTMDGQERPVAVSDFWPTWHRHSKTLLATGHTVVYTPDWKVTHPRPRHTAYSTYQPDTDNWTAWKTLEMPDRVRFQDAGAGCVQRYDQPDGSILLPIYFRPPGKNSRVVVAHCRFDGQTLECQGLGTELSIDDQTRGLHEPSLTRFNNQYYLTIRNDKRGYVTRSDDGLHFEPIRPWKFDDQEELGNYNTQQHWITHRDGLFLVYTRRGANNDHVFRHRAPLFMARVDPQRLCVLRESEQVVVPERGARLGNFGVTQVSPSESWVTVAEWMQTWGPNHVLPVNNPYGSDGSVWVARIRWNQPG